MADPLSILGAIGLAVQTSFKVAAYIKACKEGFTERQRVLSEINSLAALCQTLRDFVEIEGREGWTKTLELLDGP